LLKIGLSGLRWQIKRGATVTQAEKDNNQDRITRTRFLLRRARAAIAASLMPSFGLCIAAPGLFLGRDGLKYGDLPLWSTDCENFSTLFCPIGAAGRVYGIDTYLARRWPRVFLW